VQGVGLRVVKKSYFFSSLLLPRGSQVVWEKMGGKSKPAKGLADYQPKPVLDSVVNSVLWADFRVCDSLARRGICLPGLSCFVLAERITSEKAR
jgi:hypothetical protein